MAATRQPDAQQFAAFSARAEQLLKEWVELWPYYTDPEVDTALRAYAFQQLQTRMAPDAVVILDGNELQTDWLWERASQVSETTSLTLTQYRWLGGWQMLKRNGGYTREMEVSLSGTGLLAEIQSTYFILLPIRKQFGSQIEVVWEVKIHAVLLP